MPPSPGASPASRALALAAIALAGFLGSLTPWAQRVDQALLDAQWKMLRKLETRPAPDQIVIVGIDDASLEALPEPPPLWHAALGRALARVAEARPRAIGFDLPLPDRSFDGVRAGLDEALFAGLARAAAAAPLVAVLSIDPATRSARRIHTPYLALLGERRLGLGLTATDPDGVARRYTLLVPTEDGGFPTLVGRLCRELSRPCEEGLIDWGLGEPILSVPLRNVLAAPDDALLARLFQDRIVLFGVTQRFGERVGVPWNLAAWEAGGADSPAVVVTAQTLRTALARAPGEGSRPLVMLLVAAASLLFVGRRWPLVAVTLAVIAALAFAAATASLRAGHSVPLAGVFFTLALAWAARAFVEFRTRRLSDIQRRERPISG